jgi:hypothetical protein
MSFSAAQAAPNRISPRGFPAWLFLFFQERILRGAWSSAAPAIFVLLFSALMAVSAGAEIAIDARVGFHGVFQLGRPFPLAVELTNSGRPAEGTLDVQVWKGGPTKGGAPYPVKYRREVFLAAQSRKTIQFTVDPDFISRPLAISYSSAGGNVAREVDLRRNFSPANQEMGGLEAFASHRFTDPVDVGIAGRVVGSEYEHQGEPEAREKHAEIKAVFAPRHETLPVDLPLALSRMKPDRLPACNAGALDGSAQCAGR